MRSLFLLTFSLFLLTFSLFAAPSFADEPPALVVTVTPAVLDFGDPGPVAVVVDFEWAEAVDFGLVPLPVVVYDLDEHVDGAPGIVDTDADTGARDYVREWTAVALRKV